jgi:predicted membrane protein (TIGR00267 family)
VATATARRANSVGEPSDDDQQNGVDRVNEGIRNSLRDIGTYFQVTGAQKIIRRYFAMNAFDGAMTSLGVVIGAYLSQISDPRSVIGVIITSGIAMMVSGFSGTYMTESAERSHSLNELEDAMLINLDNTVYGRAGKFISVFAAVVDGSAPFLASIPSLIPFLLVPGLIDIGTAFTASMAASIFTLFILGVYLGRISGENILYSGLKMVISGAAVALIALLLNVH